MLTSKTSDLSLSSTSSTVELSKSVEKPMYREGQIKGVRSLFGKLGGLVLIVRFVALLDLPVPFR